MVGRRLATALGDASDVDDGGSDVGGSDVGGSDVGGG
jgi:hypothetical protein